MQLSFQIKNLKKNGFLDYFKQILKKKIISYSIWLKKIKTIIDIGRQ